MPRAIIVLFLLLAACTTDQEIIDTISGPFIGQPFDNFVIERGPPENEFVLDGGGTIYTWSSGKQFIDIIEPDDLADEENGGSDKIEVECRLQIQVDQTGIVESFKITRDTSGEWHSSWCYETFS